MSETADPVDRLVGFARALRHEGVSIGSEQVITFCEAVGHLGPGSLDNLYWAGRAALVNRQRDIETYDRLFPRFFGTEPVIGEAAFEEGLPSEESITVVTDDDVPTRPGEETGEEVLVGAVASRLEILRHKRFDELTADERVAIEAMMAEFVVETPTRTTRRMQPITRGRRPDVRRSLRRAPQTHGEVIHLSWRRPRTRPRQVVLLLDVSGSMADYSRALLGFAHAVARSAGAVEVFCFGTRITRITSALAIRDTDMAIAAAAKEVVDWDGGTRIGAALSEFLQRWGRASMARGALVIICSDGLERDEPEELGLAMERLGRLAHRIIWINPLMGDTRYQPLARGMAAAMPHIDISLAGHNFANLEALSGVISEIGRH